MKLPSLPEISKALAATGAAAAVAVTYGFIDNRTSSWIEGAVAVGLAFLSTYRAPANKPPAP